MQPRERVIRTIEFRYPDHLPLRFASDPGRSDYVGLPLNPPTGWQPRPLGNDKRAVRASDGHRSPLTNVAGWGLDECIASN